MRHFLLLSLLAACAPTASDTTDVGTPDSDETDASGLAGPSADTATVAEGESVLIDVLANDDVSDTVVLITTPPSSGTAVVEAGGIRYTHDGGETTSDQLGYQVDGQLSEVRITVTPVNDPPEATDDEGSVDATLTVNLDLVANDVDVDDGLDLTSLVITTQPAFGTIAIVGDGTVDYTHTTRGTLTDSFRYTVADVAGAVSNEGEVTLEVVDGCDEFGTNDAMYGRYEAPTGDNACTEDTDCVVGGCSGEVCAAESVFTTCEFLASPPTGDCACLAGACVWSLCEG